MTVADFELAFRRRDRQQRVNVQVTARHVAHLKAAAEGTGQRDEEVVARRPREKLTKPDDFLKYAVDGPFSPGYCLYYSPGEPYSPG